MQTVKAILRWLFAALFVGGGINHFLRRDLYERMIPAYLPEPRLLVEASGVAEVAIGLLLLIPRTIRQAAWGSVALLVTVFPANVEMAQHPEKFPGISRGALLVRLPLQLVLIAWGYWYTRPSTER